MRNEQKCNGCSTTTLSLTLFRQSTGRYQKLTLALILPAVWRGAWVRVRYLTVDCQRSVHPTLRQAAPLAKLSLS